MGVTRKDLRPQVAVPVPAVTEEAAGLGLEARGEGEVEGGLGPLPVVLAQQVGEDADEPLHARGEVAEHLRPGGGGDGRGRT